MNIAETKDNKKNGIAFIGILILKKTIPVNSPINTVSIPSNIWKVDFDTNNLNLLAGEAIKIFRVPRLLSEIKLAPTPKKAFHMQSTKAFPMIKGVIFTFPYACLATKEKNNTWNTGFIIFTNM